MAEVGKGVGVRVQTQQPNSACEVVRIPEAIPGGRPTQETPGEHELLPEHQGLFQGPLFCVAIITAIGADIDQEHIFKHF